MIKKFGWKYHQQLKRKQLLRALAIYWLTGGIEKIYVAR